MGESRRCGTGLYAQQSAPGLMAKSRPFGNDPFRFRWSAVEPKDMPFRTMGLAAPYPPPPFAHGLIKVPLRASPRSGIDKIFAASLTV
jgi:hypothetical protein